MALTPVDILHTEFKTAVRGYKKSQVDEFVRSVTQALDEALRDRAELQRKVDALSEEVERVRKIESAMTDALTLAQKTADETKLNAHRQAEVIVAEAEQARVRMTIESQRETEKYRTEIALLESARDRFEAELRSLLNGYMEWLDRRPHEPENAKSEVA